MPSYKDMTSEDFDRILTEKVLSDTCASELLQIPGIYEILPEYFNNTVLDY